MITKEVSKTMFPLPETIFVANTLRAHATMMVSATQIGTSSLRSKKLIPEYFTDCVDRSLRSQIISDQNLCAKCEHSLNH